MKSEKFLLTMGTGLLLATGVAKGQDDLVKEKPKTLPKAEHRMGKPPALPNYPNLEKAIDLFLLEWSAKTRQPLPQKGISITPETGTKRYQLSLEAGQSRRFGAQAPRWFGDYHYSRQSGSANEVALVYDPSGKTVEDNAQNLIETRSQVRTNGGFSESYSRSYERSYSSENGSPRQAFRKSRFAPVPEATVYLYTNPRDYRAAYDAAKKSQRLITNGTHDETDEIAAYYYLLVFEE